MTWKRAGKFPCREKTCPAMVEKDGQACGVHLIWNEGPHTHPCCKCRRDIERGEQWRNLDGDPTRPAHSQCVARKRSSKSALVQLVLFDAAR